MKRIADKSIDMILCDLPYQQTALKWDTLIPLDALWEQYERIIKDNGAIVLTASQPFTSQLVMSNPKLFKHEWIWEKQKASNFMGAKYGPLKYHESVLVFSKGTVKYKPQKYPVLEIKEIMENIQEKGKNYVESIIKNHDVDRFGKVDRRKTVRDPKTMKKGGIHGDTIQKTRYVDDGTRYPKSVLKINKSLNKNIHPTQKPVALFEYLIQTYTDEEDVVLDTCMGSGTTAIAALKSKRKFLGFELDDKYFQLANERIENHSVKNKK